MKRIARYERPDVRCREGSRAFGGERGAALVIAILVLAILTVVGIALMLITSTESRIAANEWSVNRAFYSTDSGLKWAAVELTSPLHFMNRPEFDAWNGTVNFPMPSHRHGAAFFTGDTGVGSDITVRIMSPSLVGRRAYRGGKINEGDKKGQYMYAYEVRSTGGQNNPALPEMQYSKALVSDIEVGPLPAELPF